jgi:hypothetical protein
MRNGFLALALLALVACGGEGTTQSTAAQEGATTDVAAPGATAPAAEESKEESAAPAAEAPAAAPAEAPAEEKMEDERTE